MKTAAYTTLIASAICIFLMLAGILSCSYYYILRIRRRNEDSVVSGYLYMGISILLFYNVATGFSALGDSQDTLFFWQSHPHPMWQWIFGL